LPGWCSAHFAGRAGNRVDRRALMSGGAIFSLVTLPVEFDASARARAMLERYGLVTRQEAEGVKAVLDAAALTYVAAAATAILQMLYYVSLLMRRR
jgi:Predicted Zn-dependent protease